MKNALAILSCVAALSACATHSVQKMNATFVPDDYVPYARAGTATVKGQGFLRQQGGGVVTCAGSKVMMLPDTPFIREAISIAARGDTPDAGNPAHDPRIHDALKTTMCDAQGNFSFERVAAGNWLVVTEVIWTVGYSRQGGGLEGQVTAHDGEVTNILLSDDNRVGG